MQVLAMVEFPDGDDSWTVGRAGPGRDDADEVDLRAGIQDLAGLVAGSRGLPEVLAEVASFAVRACRGPTAPA